MGLRAPKQALEFVGALASMEPHDLFVLTKPEGELEVHETARGELVVWVYTDLTNLTTACGSGQPWVRMTLPQLRGLVDQAERTLMFAVDAWHPDGARYPAPDVRDQEHLPLLDPIDPDADVWIPIRPAAGGARRIMVELRALDRGQRLLPVYESLEQLRDCCGPYQAAASIRPESIPAVVREASAQGVYEAPVIPEAGRNHAPVVDWAHRELS